MRPAVSTAGLSYCLSKLIYYIYVIKLKHMNTVKFWIMEEARMEAVKAEFEAGYKNGKNPLTISPTNDGGWMMELSEVSTMDVLYIFHAGVHFGLKRGLGKI